MHKNKSISDASSQEEQQQKKPDEAVKPKNERVVSEDEEDLF